MSRKESSLFVAVSKRFDGGVEDSIIILMTGRFSLLLANSELVDTQS